MFFFLNIMIRVPTERTMLMQITLILSPVAKEKNTENDEP